MGARFQEATIPGVAGRQEQTQNSGRLFEVEKNELFIL
jgi:hypothetical protein